MSLAGKVIVLTGGGGGIGRVVARELLEEGASLVIADNSEDSVRAAERDLGTLGKLTGWALDIANIGDVGILKEKVLAGYGRADALINAAGVQGPIGEFYENDPADWIRTVHVNLIGTVLCCRAFVPLFRARGAGKIINFAGGGANAPRPHFSAYGASKAAVVRFTETLAEELKDRNIQVNAVSPGVIKTQMIEETLEAGLEKAGPEFDQLKARLRTGFDNAQDVAELICYLASESSNWLTGRNISAVWDPWREWQRKPPGGIEKDMFVLRRIDGRNYVKKA